MLRILRRNGSNAVSPFCLSLLLFIQHDAETITVSARKRILVMVNSPSFGDFVFAVGVSAADKG